MDKQISLGQESVGALLSRLHDILMEENGMLEHGKPYDHQRFVDGKNQILRDLIVFQRTLSTHPANPAMREQLVRVRPLIDRNYSLLRSHVDAMAELTNLLTEVEIDEDADGTYSKYEI